MRKFIAVVAAASLTAAASVKADIAVAIVSTFGIDSAAVPGSAPDLPTGALYQLIWSASNIGYSPFVDATPTAVSPGWVDLGAASGLGPFFTSFDGFIFDTPTLDDESIPPSTADWLVGGYVYVRIFSDAAPGAGDFYGVSQIIQVPTDMDPASGAPTPDVLEIAGSSSFLVNTPIIPEPSVLAFLGLGAAVMAVRRFRRS